MNLFRFIPGYTDDLCRFYDLLGGALSRPSPSELAGGRELDRP
jgi:hypothetical protein